MTTVTTGGEPDTATTETLVRHLDGWSCWKRVVIEGYPLPALLPPPPGMQIYSPHPAVGHRDTAPYRAGVPAGVGVPDDRRVRLTVSREEGRAVAIGALCLTLWPRSRQLC